VLVGRELTLDLILQATGVEAKVDVTATGNSAIETGRQLSQLYLQAPGSVNSGSGET
jgi:hypothetical protein